MTSPALSKLCDLVAEVAMSNALSVRHQIGKLVPGLSEVDRSSVLATLAFMNWTFASGVWSNLPDTRMRRDLQFTLKEALILRLAGALSETSAPSAVAARAVALNDDFKAYVQAYNSDIQTTGHADSRFATLFALERIQEACRLADATFGQIISTVIPSEGLGAEVESVAGEVNKVAPPKRRGFLSRFFEGR